MQKPPPMLLPKMAFREAPSEISPTPPIFNWCSKLVEQQRTCSKYLGFELLQHRRNLLEILFQRAAYFWTAERRRWMIQREDMYRPSLPVHRVQRPMHLRNFVCWYKLRQRKSSQGYNK